jgi:hypothetical protein
MSFIVIVEVLGNVYHNRIRPLDTKIEVLEPLFLPNKRLDKQTNIAVAV